MSARRTAGGGLLLAIVLGACLAPLAAAGPAAVVAAADTLVVRARAVSDPVAPASGGLVTHLDLDDEGSARDLADLLAATAGFQVRRTGPLGFAAVPSLRGSAAAQIRLFLDGMPLEDAQSGAADLSLLPLERLAAAEIHRGVVPGGLGGIGGAGAVHLISRRRQEGAEVRLQSGSWGERGGRLSWGASDRGGRRSLLLLAHVRRADNDYAYLDHNQTFHNTADDTVRLRRNAAFAEWGGWLSAGWRPAGWDCRFSAGHFRKDGGRPGPLGGLTPHVGLRHQRSDAQLGLGWRQDLLRLDLGGAGQDQFLYDPRNEVVITPPGTTRTRNRDLGGRLAWAPSWRPGAALGRLDLLAGAEGRRQWHRLVYRDDPDPLRTRTTWTVFASVTATAARDRLRLTPAWRWQRNEDDFPPLPAFPWLPEPPTVRHVRDAVSPSLGLVWDLRPDVWALEAHWSRSVRMPTWVELFGHLGGIDGNRELEPEALAGGDLALSWRPLAGGGALRAAVFEARTDRTIVFLQNSPGTSRAVNLGRTRTRGVELEGDARLPAGLELAGNVTWQQARDRGEEPAYAGNPLPYLADREAWLRLRRPGGRWRPQLEAAWNSGFFRDRAATGLDRAPARLRLNLGLARTGVAGGRRWTLTAEVLNLTDDRTLDVEEFPLPGRSWHLSLAVDP